MKAQLEKGGKCKVNGQPIDQPKSRHDHPVCAENHNGKSDQLARKINLSERERGVTM